MRELLYRVVEAKVLRTDKGFHVNAYLLVRGQGKPVHFDIFTMAELPAVLAEVVKEAYSEVTGSELPDIAPSGPQGLDNTPLESRGLESHV